MHRAIAVAAGHQPHPNPSVGAVVVTSEGKNVGEGNHMGPGEDHAEVVALNAAGDQAQGSDLYVTLEPCSFHGRTRPCVDVITEAGISRVFVGITDPDDRVSGGGIEKLLKRRIQVVVWDETDTAEAVDPAYFHHRRTGRARITLKYAMTLDGSVAADDGSSQWITSDEARRDAHLLRSGVDAVIVGAGTLRTDDPRLDVRLEGYEARQPRPILIAGTSPLPADSQIWDREPVVLATSKMVIPSGELIEVPGEEYPDPVSAAQKVGDLGYLECLLEGGPTLAGAWWRAGLVAKGFVYIGSKIGGGVGVQPFRGAFADIDSASEVEVVDVRTVGPDVRIEFR